MQIMAKRFTKPHKFETFCLSASTKRLGATARLDNTPEAWKAYNRAVRLEHQQCQTVRVERACADWTLYREHHRRRKQQCVGTPFGLMALPKDTLRTPRLLLRVTLSSTCTTRLARWSKN